MSLSKIPLPRIGSFVINDDGVLCLQNRPLASEIQEMENEGIPIDIPRDCVYATSDSYVVDMLSCHESRLRYQPNAIFSEGDCISQITALTLMKAIFPWIFRRDLRRGPFLFTLTDLHESNIVVDEQWNITCLLDLEWGVSRPAEMFDISLFWQSTPDGLVVDHELREDFIAVLEEEEQSAHCPKLAESLSVSAVMKWSWETQAFWYALALRSPKAIIPIFHDHISAKYVDVNQIDLSMNLRYYWPDLTTFIASKIHDKESYDRRLREAFSG